MSATQYNFTIEQGASYTASIPYATGGVPVDLSNFSHARMQWKTDSDTYLSFTTNNTNSGLYLFEFGTPLSSGIINFKIPASITGGYTFTSADYDMELVSNSDFYPGGGPEVIRLIQGTVTILPEITKIN
jgi:hypothetical protein